MADRAEILTEILIERDKIMTAVTEIMSGIIEMMTGMTEKKTIRNLEA